MSSVRKFQFDESFDTDLPRRPKPPEPEPEIELPPPPPPPPTFSEAELAAARKEGYAEGERAGQGAGYGKGFAEGLTKGMQEGFQQGKTQAEDQIANRIAGALERIGAGVDRMLAEREAVNAMRSDQPYYIALSIVRRLMPEMVQRYGVAEIEGVVRQFLTELIDEPRLIIRIAPDIAGEMRERLEEMTAAHGFDTKLVIIEEPGIQPGDCTIEWAEGGAERDTAHLMADIEARAAPLLDAPAF